MTPWRAFLLDDERLARAELRRLLAAHPEIEVVGEARNGDEALQLIPELKPDLLFLDVQMPGLSGFDVLNRLNSPPAVIFTTAFDRHAVQAFEQKAVDYLLKPIAPARLAAALDRLPPRTKLPPLDQVFVRDGDRCWLVKLSEIALFESEGNYTRLHFGKDKPLVLRSLNQLEERLDPTLFFRASRQHIINLKAVTGLEPGVGDNLVATLSLGLKVELSRRQSLRLRELLSL